MYSTRARILSPFRTPPNASTLKEWSFFDHFWVDPETLNYIAGTHKSSRVSRFFRGRMKKSKTRYTDTNGPKMDHCLRPSFTLIFRKIQQTSRVTVFCSVQTMLQKVMKITRFELLWGPFIHRDQASKRVHKIMQNDAKMHHKSARNDHEKTQIPMLQCSKTHAVDRAAKLHENAFILVVPVLRCSKNEFQNHPKSSRIYPKCPPRGGPIRSVYFHMIILRTRFAK